jgi:ADP-ribose pyrophosphatase
VTDDALKITKHEVLYRGFFGFKRYRLRHKLFAGGWSDEIEREVFERGATVGVLLYDPDLDAVVLVEQFRLPPHLVGLPAWQLEIVAGIVDRAGESATALARREAQEEAGLILASDPQFIHRYMPSPGACTEIVDLYWARVDSSMAGGIHGLKDEHEDIRVVVLSFAEAMARLEAGEIPNGLTMLALYWLALHRDRLRGAKA